MSFLKKVEALKVRLKQDTGNLDLTKSGHPFPTTEELGKALMQFDKRFASQLNGDDVTVSIRRQQWAEVWVSFHPVHIHADKEWQTRIEQYYKTPLCKAMKPLNLSLLEINSLEQSRSVLFIFV